ncbi:MAG: bifunctional DNA-formamidopyrimidine glycosylase/DNA-(apurinic or apyrimidinic site) lyase [Rhodobacteraceae bacterium]|nr:bifunctional DNA-formamidopyrimidine glycosylase/DNA-(apurinic or apyrimidinic site) lyase [Paracoccaceae bacterium]
MPELPEVETVRRGLAKHLADHTITDVEVRRPHLRWIIPAEFVSQSRNTRICAIRRRGKYLLWDLSNEMVILMHLGMSGSLRILAPDSDADLLKHDHVIWHLDTRERVTFHDPRRFGMIDLLNSSDESTHPRLAILGPEPFASDFNTASLVSCLAARTSPIKNALLDQMIVAGIGNIYASEILWASRIPPQTPAMNLHAENIDTLIQATRRILHRAIAASGSTLRNYRSLEGEVGRFQNEFAVYDREGERCRRRGCDGRIRRIVQSGRSTFYCPHCQDPDKNRD